MCDEAPSRGRAGTARVYVAFNGQAISADLPTLTLTLTLPLPLTLTLTLTLALKLALTLTLTGVGALWGVRMVIQQSTAAL